MGIQIWSGYNQMQSFHKVNEIPVVSPEEIKKQQSQTEPVQMTPVTVSEQEPVTEDLRSRNADLENISLTFNKEDTYDYLGSESGLASLDMQKAISDMKKDSILQEYQYFVGNSKNFFNTRDGIVLPK